MDYDYFNDYKEHPDAKLDESLFWEYDLSQFDYQNMKSVVVQRVIERGWPQDWYAMMNTYGEEVIRIIRLIPCLNDKDMNFVSSAFQIPSTKINVTNRNS